MRKYFFMAQCFWILSLSANESPLPGRLGNNDLFTARFGDSRMFFYMTPEKYEMAKSFIEVVNSKMLHAVTLAELGCTVSEISPVATTDPDPLGHTKFGEPIFLDNIGTHLFREHSRNVKNIAEHALGIKISALSQEMSLIMNYDANKFHQDQCPVQYEYLNNHAHPIPRYTIYQDLTLINWEMGKGTFSGTILEDADSEDSFILCFFDDEIVCNVYTEPAIYLGPNVAPAYPGAETLAPHSPIPPIDRFASMSVGSGKGKRVSVAVRGLVRTEEIDDLEERSVKLPVMRPAVKDRSLNVKDYVYRNELLLRHFNQFEMPFVPMTRVIKLRDQDQVEIYASRENEFQEVVEFISKSFGCETSLEEIEVRHLIKRGHGFSCVSQEDLELEGEYDFYVLNRSCIPENYRHYPLGEDSTTNGFPWIQLMHFPHNRVMKIPSRQFGFLVLTPIDEIMFRDGIFDIESSNPNDVFEKFYTLLHIIAVPRNEN